MTIPVPGALVTATPAQAGLPTVSGFTNSSGNAALPLVTSSDYTLRFTGAAVGTVSLFAPKNTTFTLYKLKNKGIIDISIAEQALNAGASVAAHAQSFAVKPKIAGAGSWHPSGLFKTPTDSKTSLVMPGSDQSISYVHTAITKLYVVDGENSATGLLNVNTAYTPTTNTWSSRTNDTTARSSPAAATVGSKYYVFDGSASTGITGANHAYDPSTNAWSTKASDTTARCELPAVTINSIAYVIEGSQLHAAFVSVNHAYDPSLNTWSTKATDVANAFMGAAVYGSKFYVIGGKASGLHNINHAYDHATNTWSTKTPDTMGRDALGAGTVGNFIYAQGGYWYSGGSRTSGTTNHQYNPAANSWLSKQSATQEHNSFKAGVINAIMYRPDGLNNAGASLKSVDGYDPSTNTWATKAEDLLVRFSPAVAVL